MARFVLVHGAFHGAWCWEPLASELEAAGHEVVALDLPGHGDDATPPDEVTLAGAVRVICDALQAGEPAILVAHSMGGVPVTQAAEECPDQIRRVVYVTAYIPLDGQSLVDLSALPESETNHVAPNMVVEPPVAMLPAEKGIEVFYQCCAPEQANRASSRMCPSALSLLGTPVSLTDAKAPPAAFVVCKQDRAIPLPLQRMMLERRGCDEVLELDTDHSPFMSRASELAAFLDGFG